MELQFMESSHSELEHERDDSFLLQLYWPWNLPVYTFKSEGVVIITQRQQLQLEPS